MLPKRSICKIQFFLQSNLVILRKITFEGKTRKEIKKQLMIEKDLQTV